MINHLFAQIGLHSQMNPYSIPPLLAVMVAFLLGLLIFLKNRQSESNIAFTLFCLATIIWQLMWAVLFNVSDYNAAKVLIKIGYSGIIFLPITFFHYAVKFGGGKSDQKMSYLAYILGCILLLLLWSSNYYINGYYVYFWGYYPKANYLHPFSLLLLFFLVYRSYVIFSSQLKNKEIPPFKKEQSRYLIISLVVYSVAATDFIANYGIGFYPVGFIFVVFSLGIIAYTITKHRLMDISVVISRAVAEILTIILFGMIYLGLVWLSVNYVSPFIGWFFIAWTVVYGIVVGEVFQRVRLFVQTSSDKLFLCGKYDYYQELSGISSQIAKGLSADNILRTLQKAFYEVIEVSNPRIYLGKELETPQIKELISVREPTIKGEELILPCVIEDRLIALIILGKKLSEESYTDEDFKLLKNLSNQAAVALDHLRIYDEKLKAQRQLLLAEKLTSLGKIASETAREIDDSIKNIDRLTARIDESTNDPNFLREFQETVPREIDHLSAVIDNLLRLAKPR